MGDLAERPRTRAKPEVNRGGRPKGALNKPKRALLKLLDDKYPGYQPVVHMAERAHQLDMLADGALQALVTAAADPDEAIALPMHRQAAKELIESSLSAHNAVAKYTTPQLKAVEVKGGNKLTLKVKDLSGA